MKDNNNLINLYNDDNLFNLYLAKIKDAYQKDSKTSKTIITKYMELLNNNKSEKVKMNVNMELFNTIMLCLIIVFLGLFNLTGFGMYVFGCVFFFAGLFIGLYFKWFGLIFLFSHGMSGLGLMIGSLSNKFTGPIYSDAAGSAYFILMGLWILLVLFGLAFTILYNLEIIKKKRKEGPIYSLLLFGGAVLVCIFFPELFKILNWIL